VTRSGIYGLFDLAGGPIDHHHAARLGLPEPRGEAATAMARDDADQTAIHTDRSDGQLTILLGHLDEPAALAVRLGLPPHTLPAALARAALVRFGSGASAALIGEWSLLHHDGQSEVILAQSIARRDPLLFARSGRLLAVAPDLSRLRRMDWVTDSIDAEGLLFRLGRAPLRRAIGARTILGRVQEVASGSCVTIRTDRCHVVAAGPMEPPPPWHGTFEDALAQTELLLRRIVRARLQRTASPACLLSGGLDSSTLAWLAAGERAPGTLALFSSAAPPESGLPDETRFAAMVADRLALPLTRIVPGERPDIYRPSPATLALANGPSLSVRHYLYDAFADAALRHGMPLILDGSYGEMTITGKAPLATWRQRLGAALRPATPSLSASRGPFHVRLAAHRRQALPAAVHAVLRQPEPVDRARTRHERWGFFEGSYKSLMPTTELRAGQVRIDYPFRDTRLLRLFAGFPAGFSVRNGIARAPARRMLAGALPDAIRLRTAGMPFSPDYRPRLQRHAGQARARIAAFRAAEVDDWLDLEWLDAALARVAVHGPGGDDDAFEVQTTAMVAEFLTWWQRGS
jgi:asparagine synthase (glutamine-hydrolysing)